LDTTGTSLEQYVGCRQPFQHSSFSLKNNSNEQSTVQKKMRLDRNNVKLQAVLTLLNMKSVENRNIDKRRKQQGDRWYLVAVFMVSIITVSLVVVVVVVVVVVRNI
jgi:Flp pilus assembly protein TadB